MSTLTSKLAKFNSGTLRSPEALQVLKNAYLLLGLTLLPTIVGAYLGVLFPLYAVTGGIGGMLLFIVGAIAFINVIHRNKQTVVGIYWLLAFTLFVGFFIGPTIGLVMGLANGFKIIAMAIGGTAALFLILSGYAQITQRNFSQHSLGISLCVGLVLMIIMGVVNMIFLQMPAVALAISFVVLIICSMFIIYDTNKVIRGGETNYIVVATGFYLSLLNIFQSLMNLTGFFSLDE